MKRHVLGALEEAMRKQIVGDSWEDSAFLLRASYSIRFDPSGRHDNLGFRLAKPTISSNTGEDEQPDNPTTHLECT